jgi:hypothetical protein
MKRSDFLQRLIGIAGFGSAKLQAIIPKRKIYLQQFFVAGFRHYKGMELLEYMQENDFLELRREPDNEYDNSAIALYWQQEKIGYVPADLNELISRLIDAKALPLIGTITHLKKEVKPWERVAGAIYFLQDSNFEIPPYANDLIEPIEPNYSSKRKKEKDLFTDIFDNYNGIVEFDSIEIPDIKSRFESYLNNKQSLVYYNGSKYINITTNDIYTYMYNVSPIKSVIADDGKEYTLFEFVEFIN